MNANWMGFCLERIPELWLRTGEHIILTGVSTGVAIQIGIPLGILVFRFRRLRSILLGSIGILQTIPSLAMLAILLALLHKIGILPALIALILYALLPIVRNTLTGLEQVPEKANQAARGIGMTRQQRLWIVQLPLALPVIIAGIRTSAVVGVGIATLSAFIGAGGLGQFINRGLALSNTRLILLGAIPAALLALLVDISIAGVGWGLDPRRKVEKGTLKGKARTAALLLPLLIFAAGGAAYFSKPSAHTESPSRAAPGLERIRIGSKNFTEQLVLGELMALMIESHTDFSVERVFNLGGTMICHEALIKGEIDMYPEYTGTGLTAILKQEAVANADSALAIVRKAYRKKFNAEWLQPFGFNNTYALAVRKMDAEAHNWSRISDITVSAPELRAGFTAEFSERPDGYPGLSQKYGFTFGSVKDLDPGLMYRALEKGEVDVICAFATDGRITAYNLVLLEDDKNYFPPYYSAPIVRKDILNQYSETSEALSPLAGLLDDSTMRYLNYEVDENKRTPDEVAKQFLLKHGLIMQKHGYTL